MRKLEKIGKDKCVQVLTNESSSKMKGGNGDNNIDLLDWSTPNPGDDDKKPKEEG